MRRCIDVTILLVFFAALAFFAVPHLARAFLVGACCADDAYFSVISRRLAETGQYGFPISDSQTLLFDPLIGSGPVLIGTGALGILLFGHERWVPSLVTMLHFGALLAAYLWLLGHTYKNVLLYGAAMILVMTSIAGYHNYFSIFVGEAPMLGYLALGVACLAAWRPGTHHLLLAGGLVLSLAILTKLIAIFSVLGIVGLWFLLTWRAQRWMAISSAVLLSAAIATPLIAFELTKFLTLGVSAYQDHWKSFSQITRTINAFDGSRLELFFRGIASYRFGIPETILLIVSLIATLVLTRRNEGTDARITMRLFLLFLAGGTVHFIYMLVMSGPNSRYFFPGVMLLALALPTPLLIMRLRHSMIGIAALAALVATPSSLSASQQWTLRNATGNYIVEQRRILELLEHHGSVPLVGQSWHSIYDLVYLLPPGQKWYTTNDETTVRALRAVVVFNKFVVDNYKMPNEVRETCRRDLAENVIYEVYICGQGGKRNPTVSAP